ncbi:MAG: alpha/beta hydrolase [Alphaproteobacteria bacterium]
MTIHTDLLGTETYFVETPIGRTRVIEAGEGPALFLLHGGGGHAEAFSRNLMRLAQGCRAISLDLLWHGLSSAPAFEDPNWLKQFTRQILELMDALGIDKASVEAESAPGWVPIDMALNHSDRVEKIILNNIWGVQFKPGTVSEHEGSSDNFLKTSLRALENPTMDTIRERMRPLFPAGGLTEEIVAVRRALWSRPATREGMRGFYEHLFAPETNALQFTEADVAAIRHPALVLWSDGNALNGPDAGERLHGLIQGSRFHVIENAGQWSQWEQPEEHDRLLLEFLAA